MRATGSAQHCVTSCFTFSSTWLRAAAAAGRTPLEPEPSRKSAADLSAASEGTPSLERQAASSISARK